jgi:hypothetical protein
MSIKACSDQFPIYYSRQFISFGIGSEERPNIVAELRKCIPTNDDPLISELIKGATIKELESPADDALPSIVHLAATHGKVEAVTILVQKFQEEHSKHLAVKNNQGETALHIAITKINDPTLSDAASKIALLLIPQYSVEDLLAKTTGDNPQTALERLDQSKAPQVAKAIKGAIKKSQMLTFMLGLQKQTQS